ncbi:RDD family protein [Nocardiopsis deserti]|uniref:RDD family protein n=1 Tax=Nocardiopsis deserti TaxID=2605988 RepID=UPI00123ABB9B|nr:RDD family protein [Nocardiopsis deserti]
MSDESRGPATAAAGDDFQYRGNRLGLPESGPGSVPGVMRRLVGLLLDWALSLALAWGAYGVGLVGADAASQAEAAPVVSNTALVVFAVMNILLLTLFGTTVGRRLVGVGITATGERSWPWFVSMTVRTLLLCLVIPAVIYDRDTRGLHDRAAGTVATRY